MNVNRLKASRIAYVLVAMMVLVAPHGAQACGGPPVVIDVDAIGSFLIKLLAGVFLLPVLTIFAGARYARR